MALCDGFRLNFAPFCHLWRKVVCLSKHLLGEAVLHGAAVLRGEAI